MLAPFDSWLLQMPDALRTSASQCNWEYDEHDEAAPPLIKYALLAASCRQHMKEVYYVTCSQHPILHNKPSVKTQDNRNQSLNNITIAAFCPSVYPRQQREQVSPPDKSCVYNTSNVAITARPPRLRMKHPRNPSLVSNAMTKSAPGINVSLGSNADKLYMPSLQIRKGSKSR